jgi:hypothetical protein
MRPWAMLVGLAVVFALVFFQFTNRPLVSAIVSAIVATGAFSCWSGLNLATLTSYGL